MDERQGEREREEWMRGMPEEGMNAWMLGVWEGGMLRGGMDE